MSEEEQNDHPILATHYRIALASGVTKEQAKQYAAHQLREKFDISHLKIT